MLTLQAYLQKQLRTDRGLWCFELSEIRLVPMVGARSSEQFHVEVDPQRM